jgi:hypothetical protein
MVRVRFDLDSSCFCNSLDSVGNGLFDMKAFTGETFEISSNNIVRDSLRLFSPMFSWLEIVIFDRKSFQILNILPSSRHFVVVNRESGRFWSMPCIILVSSPERSDEKPSNLSASAAIRKW